MNLPKGKNDFSPISESQKNWRFRRGGWTSNEHDIVGGGLIPKVQWPAEH